MIESCVYFEKGTLVPIGESEIKRVMGKAWGIDPADVPSGAKFNELVQWDSMGHVSLMLVLEEEYGITINYETLTELTSISAIIESLKEEKHAG